jgi:hypothetical protein
MPKRQTIQFLGNGRILAKFIARFLVRLVPEQAVDALAPDHRPACKCLTALPELAEFTLKAPR